MASKHSNWITEIVCPAFGVILANAMYAAPIKSLREALSRGDIGDLNPMPWAMMTGTCLGWTAYGLLKKDIFVLLANAPPLILSFWLNSGAIKLQYMEQYRQEKKYSLGLTELTNVSDKLVNSGPPTAETITDNGDNILEEEFADEEESSEQKIDSQEMLPAWTSPAFSSQEKIVILSIILWVILLSSIAMISCDRDTDELIVGYIVNINLVFFYGAPLSTIGDVISTRNSASIHKGTLIMVIFNTFFWLVYGLAILDFFIIIPNACGFCLSLLQAFLCRIYPTVVNSQ